MALKINTKFKLILGLGNKDIKSAPDMALLYANAGVRFFDASPEVLPEISRALVKAGYDLNDFILCASVPSLGDIHGRKANISPVVCSGCMLCAKDCPEQAVLFDKKAGKCSVDMKKCIGCGICKKTTNCYAIHFEYGNHELKRLEELVQSGFKLDMTEFHASVSDKKQILKDFKDILSVFKGDVSVCINRKQFPLDDVVKLLVELKKMHKLENPEAEFYVQADGASMNGGAEDEDSTLECILFARELAPYGFNLIISGGTNINTPKMLKDAEIEAIEEPIIAYGTYARKIISNTKKDVALLRAKELFAITEGENVLDPDDVLNSLTVEV